MRARGFTLLEVLVALAVVGTGLTAMARLTAASVATLDTEMRRAQALLAARAMLADATLAPPPLGRRDGVRTDGVRWEETVEPTPHPRLRTVRVRVFATPDTPIELVEVVRVPAS